MEEEEVEEAPPTCAALAPMGSSLLAACVGVIGAPACSRAVHRALLGLVEGLLDAGPVVREAVLLPHLTRLLSCLRRSILREWAPAGGEQGRTGQARRSGPAHKVTPLTHSSLCPTPIHLGRGPGLPIAPPPPPPRRSHQ